MKKFLIYTLACVVLVSCYTMTDEEILNELETVEFDTTIINKLPEYEAFKNFLVTNIDTLIESGSLEFPENSSFYRIQNSQLGLSGVLRLVPDFLQKDFKKHWEQFSDDYLFSAEIYKYNKYNGCVITAKSYELKSGLTTWHKFFWRDHKDISDFPYTYCKDTLLRDSCYYLITAHYERFND